MRLCPDTVEALLHRAIPPIAPFHRMRRRWQHCVIEKDQRLLQCGRKELLEALTEMREAVQTPPQLCQCVSCRLRSAASIEQRRDLLHDLAYLPSLGQTSCDAPQPLACTWAQVMCDKQVPMRAHIGTLLCQSLFLAGRFLGTLCARTALGHFRLRGRQALALTGDGASHRFDDFLDHMALTHVMRHLPKDFTQGVGRPLRAIGGDTPQRQVAPLQGACESSQEGPDVLMVGMTVQDLREKPLVVTIIDRGEHTEGTIVSFINGHGA